MADVLSVLQDIGYEDAASLIRDVLRYVAYGEQYTPKSEELPKIMSKLVRPYMTSNDAQALVDEFIEFINHYNSGKDSVNWQMVMYRNTEDNFFQSVVPLYEYETDKNGKLRPAGYNSYWQDCEFMTDYFEYTGHSLTPMDLQQLVRSYYNNPEIRTQMRAHFTSLQRQMIIAKSRGD